MSRRPGRQPLSPSARELAGDPSHLAMARRLALKWAARRPGLAEEFESAAMMALVESAQAFDPSRGVRFQTFASIRMLGAILRVVRESVPRGFRDDATARGGSDKRKAPVVLSLSFPLPEAMPSRSEPIGRDVEAADELESLMRRLMPREREAIRLYHFGSPGTLDSTSRAMGVTREWARQLVARGLERMRDGRSMIRSRGRINKGA